MRAPFFVPPDALILRPGRGSPTDSLDNECQQIDGLRVTTPDRTAFDLGRHGGLVALDLVDAGAESPKESWLRLLVIRNGYPRPRTQIPVAGPDGWPLYYLDMGWEDITLTLEYDGVSTGRIRGESHTTSNALSTAMTWVGTWCE